MDKTCDCGKVFNSKGSRCAACIKRDQRAKKGDQTTTPPILVPEGAPTESQPKEVGPICKNGHDSYDGKHCYKARCVYGT